MRAVSALLVVALLGVILVGQAQANHSVVGDGSMAVYSVADGIKARIVQCQEYPEMLFSVNRATGPTCGEPPTVDNTARLSLMCNLRADPDERDIVCFLDDALTPTAEAFWRLTPYGLVVATDQIDVSSIGTFPVPVYDGIQVLGTDVRVQADFYVARVEQRPYHAYVIQDETGTFQWGFRLGADNSLSLIDATGDVVQTWVQVP